MATPLLKDVLATFSPRGDQFAITTGDGRVKTWSVSDGHLLQEFTEIAVEGQSVLTNGHLSLDYSTLAWGAIPKQGSKKKGSLLALGSRSGDVIAWDPVLGEVKWKLSNCNPGGVNALCFLKDQEALYASGADGMVCEVNASTGSIGQRFRGSKNIVTAIAASPDGERLVVASGEVKLFNLSTRKRVRKFTGHASTVRTLCFTRDGRYILSAAAGDRHVAVWDCESSQKGAILVLSMEHSAIAVDSRGFGKEGSSLCILAVSEWGETYVWRGSSLEELGKSSPVRISVASGSKKSSRQCTIFARFLNTESISLVRGTTVKPTFETLSVEGQKGNVVLEARAAGHLSSKEKTSLPAVAPNDATVDILGPDNAADASMLKHVESEASNKKKRRADRELDEPDGTVREPDEAVEARLDELTLQDSAEPTMEERLIELGILRYDQQQPPEEVVPPKADSLDVLLTQALQAGDDTLLDQCLQMVDNKVITNTIKQLRPQEAANLLKASVSRLESRARRASNLMPWIRDVLLVHAASIVADASLRPVLVTLHQIVEARLHIFVPLLSLSGRLELIAAQVTMNDESMKAMEEPEPAVVYEEEDSDQDVEDAMEDEEMEEEEEQAEAAGDRDGEADAMQEDEHGGDSDISED